MSGSSVWPKFMQRLKPRLRCSFCRRSAEDVERLVSGTSAYICDTCIAACVAVLERHGGFAASARGTRPLAQILAGEPVSTSPGMR